MIECLCEHGVKSEVRLNPTTLRALHLCPEHADLHDSGVTFIVRETHYEESR